MDFSPEQLRQYRVFRPAGAHEGYEYYDRRALISAVPEKSREAYMDAAEKWIAAQGGRHFGPGAGALGGGITCFLPAAFRSTRTTPLAC
jgi:hypothetical protein